MRKIDASQKLLVTGDAQGAKILCEVAPLISILSEKIAQGNELAALVPDCDYQNFTQAMDSFAKTFCKMAERISEMHGKEVVNHRG